MANEITVRAQLSITKSGTTASGDTTDTIDLTGNGKYSNVQTIGTSEEIISFPADLVTEGVGYIWLKNLDATNYVEIFQNITATRHLFAKLKAGEVMVWRCPKAATNDPDIYATANTASIALQVVASGT